MPRCLHLADLAPIAHQASWEILSCLLGQLVTLGLARLIVETWGAYLCSARMAPGLVKAFKFGR